MDKYPFKERLLPGTVIKCFLIITWGNCPNLESINYLEDNDVELKIIHTHIYSRHIYSTYNFKILYLIK